MLILDKNPEASMVVKKGVKRQKRSNLKQPQMSKVALLMRLS